MLRMSVLRGVQRMTWSHRLMSSASNRALLNFSSDIWSADRPKEIEAHWGHQLKTVINERPTTQGGQKYVLSMFPYPSGRLHMGHVRVYSISDALNLYYRLKGDEVIHPMGFDSFGLPAENAAIQQKLDAKTWTMRNIEQMREQLRALGFQFDWSREISTCDPSYYKWTQWLFVKLFEHKLTYRSLAKVNFDPVDQTVLADEQVDDNGCSWRSGAKVERRALKQWFLRTTHFSQSLIEGLMDPSLKHWRDVTKIQRDWIGECNGTNLQLDVINVDAHLADQCDPKLSVWTDVPELLQAATFVLVSSDHVLNEHQGFVEREYWSQSLKCTVRRLRPQILNPLTNESMPIFVFEKSDLLPFKCQAYLGVPDINNNYCIKESAVIDEMGFNLVHCVSEHEDHEVVRLPGSPYDGMERSLAIKSALDHLKSLEISSGSLCSSKLQDWLISRQRYWGTPIPIIHCPNCGPVPVPEDQLPVMLPDLSTFKRDPSKEFRPTLAMAEDWVNVKCPNCGNEHAKRETDTMDTFVDSSWYYLRYLDNKNEKEMVSMAKAKASLPVSVYIGGKEHAALHLYYARFVSHFLHSIGVSPVKEPFTSLVTQGVVKAQSYRLKPKDGGQYVYPSDVEYADGKAVAKDSKLPLIVEWEKMSKSKLNGVDPQAVVDRYGCDTTRWLMLSDVSPSSERKWSEDSLNRVQQMQLRLYKLVSLAVTLPQQELPAMDESKYIEHKDHLWDSRNYYVKAVNHNFSLTRNLAIALARIQGLLGELWKVPGQVKRDCAVYQKSLGQCIIMLTPIAPHFSAEMWEGFNQNKHRLVDCFKWDQSVFQQDWPELDSDYQLKLIVRKNEEQMATFKLDQFTLNDLTEKKAVELCSEDAKVRRDILHRSPSDVRFKVFPNYEATLDFTIPLSAEEMEEKRQAKGFKRNRRAKKLEDLAKKREVEA